MLRNLAETKGADIERFNQLANSVEEFTTSFLDPMRGDEGLRKDFGIHLLDEILDDAIEFEQKKVSLKQNIICFLIPLLFLAITVSYHFILELQYCAHSIATLQYC